MKGTDRSVCSRAPAVTSNAAVFSFPFSLLFSQSLQNKSYNHFAAIYYLLVERLKAHRCSFPVEQRLDARQRRPSTIAEQTVVKVSAHGGRGGK